MDQFGHAQPIGGVNEKIEGFFDVCSSITPLSTQGVIIPRANVHNLMLRNDVIEAVEQSLFHIWAIDHVTDAIQLLTNIIAGSMNNKGEYAHNSVFGITQNRLTNLRKDHHNAASNT